jgi:hypothetical protein
MAEAQRLCRTADEIWLYLMARFAGTEFCHSGWTNPLVAWGGSQLSALWRVNVTVHGNDRCLEAMIDQFAANIALERPQARAMAA